MSPPVTFPSKRDAWLVVVIWISVAMMAAGVALPWFAGGFSLVALLTTLMLLGGIALSLSVLYGTRYELTDERLLIRSGPFRWTVELGTIEAIRPTDDPTSSPACSLDRLEIARDGGRLPIMVSPGDKDGFLDAIAARDAKLVRNDSNLTRHRR